MHTGLVESICRSLLRYMQQARAASHLVSLSNLKITQDLFPFLFGFLNILYRVVLDLDFIFMAPCHVLHLRALVLLAFTVIATSCTSLLSYPVAETPSKKIIDVRCLCALRK